MKLLVRILFVLLSLLLGLIFIYSGYTKLYPLIEPFEFTFVDIGIANWYTAPILARVMIALEFFIGLLLILNYNLKKFTLPLTIGLLLFFIIYLVIQLALNGNDMNCGCFGEHIQMSPLQGIFKNVLMIGLAVLIYFLYEGWKMKFNRTFLPSLFVACLSLPFIFNPVDYAYTSNNLNEKVNYPLQLELLYHPEDTLKVKVPKQELRKGKHLLAFLSLTCPHCRVAAKKFRLIKKNNPAISVYFVLNGDQEDYAEFMQDTKTTNIPSSFCLGKTFVLLAPGPWPRIYYLEDGMVVKKVNYLELDQYQVEKWMGLE